MMLLQLSRIASLFGTSGMNCCRAYKNMLGVRSRIAEGRRVAEQHTFQLGNPYFGIQGNKRRSFCCRWANVGEFKRSMFKFASTVCLNASLNSLSAFPFLSSVSTMPQVHADRDHHDSPLRSYPRHPVLQVVRSPATREHNIL